MSEDKLPQPDGRDASCFIPPKGGKHPKGYRNWPEDAVGSGKTVVTVAMAVAWSAVFDGKIFPDTEAALRGIAAKASVAVLNEQNGRIVSCLIDRLPEPVNRAR